MIRLSQLRRSFSVDFVNDDSATVFLHEDHSPPHIQKPPSPYLPGSSVISQAGIVHHHPSSAVHTSAHGAVNMTTAVHWQDAADIEDALAADFDGSLSGLGMELGTSSFNMSEALHALPPLKGDHHFAGSSIIVGSRLHKDASPSEPIGGHQNGNSNSNQEDVRPVAIVHGKKNRLAYGQDEESVSSGTKRFCISNVRDSAFESAARFSVFANMQNNSSKDSEPECHHDECANDYRCQHRHSNSAPDLRSSSHGLPHSSSSSSPSPSSTPSSVLTQILSVQSQYANPSTPLDEPHSPRLPRAWNQFQYILCASTSMATKLHEETMTYLNQGQSYEVKLKKLGDLTEMRGKKLCSVIRVGFHERRLQFMEKELINQWKSQRHAERILEIDIPLSYGITDVTHDPQDINKCFFTWEPTKETGIYVKVNCISTEFTPKKHGGEKGVPFRLIVETHSISSPSKPSSPNSSHLASCQVKVFKPKGADRKHKTDREKMSKRGSTEQDKYQPSYDCTVFTECPVDALSSSAPSTSSPASISPPTPRSQPFSPTTIIHRHQSFDQRDGSSMRSFASCDAIEERSSDSVRRMSSSSPPNPIQQDSRCSLRSDSSPLEAAAWLFQNRFETYAHTFANFSGADLLRLTREETIEICGRADGIRFYNAIHAKPIRPRLTVYVKKHSDEAFRAIYLENLRIGELNEKLSVLLDHSAIVRRAYIMGPAGVKILMTDDVVQNVDQDSLYLVDFDKESGENAFKATLRQFK